jgi:hypothetical protein
MIQIKYPEPAFKMKNENGKKYIFDTIRKVWLLLTEEEWVRQNFVHYLIEEQRYPSTLIALEKEIILNDLRKRFDVLVYNDEHKPWMLIECKAPGINLSNDVLEQVLRYNLTVPVQFIIITNGNDTRGWEKVNSGLELINELPKWNPKN